MARGKNKHKNKKNLQERTAQLHPDIRKSVWIIGLIGIAIILILAAAGQAGPLGNRVFAVLNTLFGVGFYLLPVVAFLFAFALIAPEGRQFMGMTVTGGALFILAGLGFIDIVASGSGGYAGALIGALEVPLGAPASLVITLFALIAAFLVTLNKPLNIIELLKKRKQKKNLEDGTKDSMKIIMPESGTDDEEETEATQEDETVEAEEAEEEKEIPAEEPVIIEPTADFPAATAGNPIEVKNYVPPPASLLTSRVEKPTIGDLRANASSVKRTLESFGIAVEMGEINVGPSVTRYTLKPAEGVKIARITSLGQDLALSLAAHPIRIEAPIPGKSLVGIEVPNKTSAIVRLGSLVRYPEFQKASPLAFALGRNVNGEPIYPDIAKMPHLLIAGATGSGKSITLHALLISLLFKNSPEMLRMILIDPKRVELSIYNDIPHLLSPVITENKKAIGALRWGIQEMDRRYQILMEAGSRDIKSYNKKKKEVQLPYIVIVIDELADLMTSFGREVEGVIIRLAQMARATGIHLIVSTQRPSVEVITGLIKANITSRIALQVASQIDSRTILDGAGAEKLLGNGDLLFTTSEFSKPQRIQGSFISEDEIKGVVHFIKKNNHVVEITKKEDGDEEDGTHTDTSEEDGAVTNQPQGEEGGIDFSKLGGGGDEEDEIYEEAVSLVRQAGKASASFLQRRLRVGYARAARLLDIMEERGVIGPGEGAKPREILE